MLASEMIEKLGGNRQAIADNAGISLQQLNNMVSKKVEVEELKSGEFIVIRKDAVRFPSK